MRNGIYIKKSRIAEQGKDTFKYHHVTIRILDRWATSFEILRCRTRSTKVDFTVQPYTSAYFVYFSSFQDK